MNGETPQPDAQPPGNEPPMVLHPSPFRSIGLAVGSAIMAFVSAQLWIGGVDYAWVATGFMSVGAIFFLAHLIPGAFELRLYPQGFEVVDLYSVKRYTWAEAAGFGLRRGILGVYVEFLHQPTDGSPPRKVLLNETYGFAPYKMLQLLNEWHARAMESENTPRGDVWKSKDG